MRQPAGKVEYSDAERRVVDDRDTLVARASRPLASLIFSTVKSSTTSRCRTPSLASTSSRCAAMSSTRSVIAVNLTSMAGRNSSACRRDRVFPRLCRRVVVPERTSLSRSSPIGRGRSGHRRRRGPLAGRPLDRGDWSQGRAAPIIAMPPQSSSRIVRVPDLPASAPDAEVMSSCTASPDSGILSPYNVTATCLTN